VSQKLNSYLCAGFYPIEAANLMHAAFLFAVWNTRRSLGHRAQCTRLDLGVQMRDGATFEARLVTQDGAVIQSFRFTVFVER
jgi:hypothetical protein